MPAVPFDRIRLYHVPRQAVRYPGPPNGHFYALPGIPDPRMPLGGLGGAAANDPISVALAPLLSYYGKEINKHSGWLEAQGVATGKALVGSVMHKAAGAAGAAPVKSGMPWLDGIVDPVLDPFTRGLTREVTPALTTIILTLIGIGAAAGFVAGRLTAR